MSHIAITGRIGRSEIRYTAVGEPFLSLTVADNIRRKNQNTGEWEDGRTDWYDVTIWKGKAEALAEVAVQGVVVVVIGELVSRKWERDGQSRVAWEIKAREIGIVPTPQKRSQQQTAADPRAADQSQQEPPW